MNLLNIGSQIVTILIIGNGRLSHHLSHWHLLINKKHKILTWDRHQDPHALKRYCLQATHVWLAISDVALVPFYEAKLQGYDLKVIHFSGCIHDDRMISVHPLMTFTHQLYDDEFYSKIHFSVTGCKTLNEALPGFSNSFFQIKAEEKIFYHALCVMTGNFPQLLWTLIFNESKKVNIPEEALKIYLQQITNNFCQLGKESVTGPFIRKDFDTIEKNKMALLNSPLLSIYKTFEMEFLK